MKQVKSLGLLGIVVAALMAFGGVASATTPTSPTGTVYEGSLTASSEGVVVLDPPSLPAIECASTATGHTHTHVLWILWTKTTLHFEACQNSWHVTVASPGEVMIKSSGIVVSNGATIEATRLGITCRYATSNTELGTLTDSHETSSTATLHIHGLIPFHSGSGLCGSGASTWEGSYKINTPDSLYVD